MVKLCSADKEIENYLTVMLNHGIVMSKITCLLILVRIWWNVMLTFDASGHNPRPWNRE